MRKFVFLPILALVLAGCSDNALQTTAKALVDISSGLTAVQTTVIQAQQAGTLTVPETTAILQVCLRIDQAGQQASAIVRNQKTLSPDQRKTISTLLIPASMAIQQFTAGDVQKISNPSVKTAVLAGFTLAQTALASIQQVLGGA